MPGVFVSVGNPMRAVGYEGRRLDFGCVWGISVGFEGWRTGSEHCHGVKHVAKKPTRGHDADNRQTQCVGQGNREFLLFFLFAKGSMNKFGSGKKQRLYA